jgi:hypothetical protein
MPSPAELADRFAAALFACENDATDSVRHTLQVTSDALCTAARGGTAETKNELIKELTKHLKPDCPMQAFGILANTAGMIVEWDADPGIALPAILDRLPTMFGNVPEMVEKLEKHFGTGNIDEVEPEKIRPIAEASREAYDASREFMALRCAGCAAMTMLARSSALRIEARKRSALVESADEARDDNPYAYYISEVLGMVDGLEVLVVDVSRKLGFRVLLTGVRNNFHFFTLLQGELLSHPTAVGWKGEQAHPLAVAIARSERMIADVPQAEWDAFTGGSGHGFDRAIWTFYQWAAMQPDGSLQRQDQVPPGELPRWVWGETKPTAIWEFEGQRVVLLGPLEVGRTWGVNFFLPVHPGLRSSVTVTGMLSSEEVEHWLARFRTTQR